MQSVPQIKNATAKLGTSHLVIRPQKVGQYLLGEAGIHTFQCYLTSATEGSTNMKVTDLKVDEEAKISPQHQTAVLQGRSVSSQGQSLCRGAKTLPKGRSCCGTGQLTHRDLVHSGQEGGCSFSNCPQRLL